MRSINIFNYICTVHAKCLLSQHTLCIIVYPVGTVLSCYYLSLNLHDHAKATMVFMSYMNMYIFTTLFFFKLLS